MSRRPIEDDHRIAAWVDGRLDEAERAALERDFAADPALREDALAYERSVLAVRAVLRTPTGSPAPGLADRVLARAAAETEQPPAAAPGLRWLPWLGSLAALLLIAVTLSWLFDEPELRIARVATGDSAANAAAAGSAEESGADAEKSAPGAALELGRDGEALSDAGPVVARRLGETVERSRRTGEPAAADDRSAGVPGASPLPAAPTSPAERAASAPATGTVFDDALVFLVELPIPDEPDDRRREETTREPVLWLEQARQLVDVDVLVRDIHANVLPATLASVSLQPLRQGWNAAAAGEASPAEAPAGSEQAAPSDDARAAGTRTALPGLSGRFVPQSGDLAYRVFGDAQQQNALMTALLTKAQQLGGRTQVQRWDRPLIAPFVDAPRAGIAQPETQPESQPASLPESKVLVVLRQLVEPAPAAEAAPTRARQAEPTRRDD